MTKTFSYFVVMIDYGRKGLEAIVDPEVTRREVIARIRTGEYPADAIAFIHFISMNETPQDVTEELMTEAFGATCSSIMDGTYNRDAQAAFDEALQSAE